MLKGEIESDSSTESMNGSWVKLDPSKMNQSVNTSPKLSDGEEMETLLADAVEDQMKHSRYQESKGISKEDLSQDAKSDWVEAWASRPEQRPSKKIKMEHPTHTKTMPLSIRRTKMMKSTELSSTNLLIVIPMLVFSHAITLGIGIFIGKKLNSALPAR
ncbi:BCL2/adenovirus E1B 19 kDa protein-interacting protein 3-like [Rhopilema esculentum]|uniref:BCL2/adenovirus E1B 19 kDa protein-interacting protein 3-like n=1 Tax=Rhopilema esculentum TaxID=499914 RepID=UPI0031D10069